MPVVDGSAVIEEVIAIVHAADMLGVVKGQRYVVIEPTRMGFFVHLCHDPPDLIDRPATRTGPARFGEFKAKATPRGYILHSEEEWGPVDEATVRNLAAWAHAHPTARAYKVHDRGREAIVHVKHSTGTKVQRWKLADTDALQERDWPRRLDWRAP